MGIEINRRHFGTYVYETRKAENLSQTDRERDECRRVFVFERREARSLCLSEADRRRQNVRVPLCMRARQSQANNVCMCVPEREVCARVPRQLSRKTYFKADRKILSSIGFECGS